MTGDRSHGAAVDGNSGGSARAESAASGRAGLDVGSGSAATAEECRLGRGQTSLDFATGMSVFLIMLIAVLLFIPGMLEPFTRGGQDDIVTANRVGDQLSEGLLGDPASPHVLNTSCTVAFFENRSQDGCRFSGATVQDRVGVADWQLVNVSLQGNVTEGGRGGEEILCWNGSQQLEERSVAGSCETRFAIGSTPPNRGDATVTARRVVSINRSAGSDEKIDVALVVEVW